jgi:hypothetical protein
MIEQILPNNNERCYSNFSPTFREVNTPLMVCVLHSERVRDPKFLLSNRRCKREAPIAALLCHDLRPEGDGGWPDGASASQAATSQPPRARGKQRASAATAAAHGLPLAIPAQCRLLRTEERRAKAAVSVSAGYLAPPTRPRARRLPRVAPPPPRPARPRRVSWPGSARSGARGPVSCCGRRPVSRASTGGANATSSAQSFQVWARLAVVLRGSASPSSSAPPRLGAMGPPLPAREICIVGERRRIFAFRLVSNAKWALHLRLPLELDLGYAKLCVLPIMCLGYALPPLRAKASPVWVRCAAVRATWLVYNGEKN